jgi:hypothetical protein
MSNSLPLRVYNGTEWVNIGVQSGQVLYQNEEPSSPQTGSIWIDSDDETAVLNDQDFLTINSASAIYAPSASPTFSGQVNLPATTNYDGNLLSATLGGKLDTSSYKAGMELITSQSFSAVSSVSINDCFSATYQNYRLIFNGSVSGDVIMQARLRVAGSDNSTANSYVSQDLQAYSTTVAAFRTTSNIIQLFTANVNQRTIGIVDIGNPFSATATAFFGVSNYPFDQASISLVGATHNQTVSYDGLTISPAAGTTTGTIRIYGYRD